MAAPARSYWPMYPRSARRSPSAGAVAGAAALDGFGFLGIFGVMGMDSVVGVNWYQGNYFSITGASRTRG